MTWERSSEQIQADIDDVRANMPWSDERDEALDDLYRELAEVSDSERKR